MQSSICGEDVDEGGPDCRTVSTERDGQPPASEPPPVTANFEPPPDPPKSERPLKPEAFLARQRQLGSLGGKCAGSVGENKFLVQLAVDGRARCPLLGRAPAPKVIVDPPAPRLMCERGLPMERGKHIYKPKRTDGAYQKQNGKWANCTMFPGRDFDDLDAYRAAKKQRVEQRAAYSGHANRYDKRRS